MWYKILGVNEDATIEEVNEAYTRLYSYADDSSLVEIAEAYVEACKHLKVKPFKKKRKLKNSKMWVKVVLCYVLVVCILFIFSGVNRLRNYYTSNDVQSCLEIESTNNKNPDFKVINNAVRELGFVPISDDDSKEEHYAMYEKIIEKRKVFFQYARVGDKISCQIGTKDVIKSMYKDQEVDVVKHVSTSNKNIKEFKLTVQIVSDKTETLEQTINKNDSLTYFKIEDKKKYYGEDFYDFISEYRAIKDRDIISNEIEQLIKVEE